MQHKMASTIINTIINMYKAEPKPRLFLYLDILAVYPAVNSLEQYPIVE